MIAAPTLSDNNDTGPSGSSVPPGTERFAFRDYLVPLGLIVLASVFLWLVSLYNFALYHTTVEFTTIAISVAIFLLIWKSRWIIDNNYLLFIGVTFIFIAILDFLHTLVYQGIGIFAEGGGTLSTELWIAARYLQAVTLLAAPLFLRRKIRLDLVAVVYLAADILIIASIFIFRIFPATYIPGLGLTPFKVLSEYLISLLLIVSVFLLYRIRDSLDRHVFTNLVVAIFLTIAAELTFTEYASFTDVFSLIGHVFRLVSYYFFYRAIIVMGQEQPYNILYRNLNESEKKYRALTDLSPDAIIVVQDGIIRYVNEAGTRLSGVASSDLPGRSLGDFIHPKDRAQSEARIAAVLNEQVTIPLHELTLVLGDKTVYAEATAGPVIWEGKKAVQVVIRDITQRKITEDRLRDQARILSIISDAIIVVDTSFTITSWNARAEELYGWRADEVLGRPARDILRSELVGLTRDEAYARLARGESVNMESVQYTRNDQKLIVRGYTVPLTDTHGTITGYVTVNHDITARRHAEEALKDSERTARAILSATKESIWLFDTKGTILMANPIALERLGGKSPGEIIGHPFGEFMSPALAADRSLQLNEVIRSRKPLRFEDERDGIFFDHSFYPVFDGNGAVTGIVTFSQDITDRKRSEDALTRAHEQTALILDSISDSFLALDRNWRFTFVNRHAVPPGLDQSAIIGHVIWEIYPQIVGTPLETFYRQSMETRSSLTFTNRSTVVQGRIYELHSYPVSDGGLAIFGQDITERIRAEEALRVSEETARARSEELALLMNSVPAAVWIAHDPDAVHITGNAISYEWLRIPYGGEASKSAPEGARPETFRLFRNGRELPPGEMPVQMAARGTEIRNFEFDLVYPDGTVRNVLGNASPLFDGQGNPTGSVSSFIDITERKRAEENLREAHRRTTVILEGIADTFYSLDKEWRFTVVNPAAEKAPFNRPAAELLGRVIWDLYPALVGTRIHQHYLDAAKKRTLEHYEAKSPLNGQWYEVFMKGGNDGVDVYMRDITSRKKAEEGLKREHDVLNALNQELTATQNKLHRNIEVLMSRERQLQEALAEKEILLSEIHHRVKNNLTAFISLLSLDGSYDNTDSGRALRKDLQNRARSMALIHETLYQTGKFSSVDMDMYMKTLVGHIADSYVGMKGIRTLVESADVSLDLPRATTAGLIINELVTNSFKYAFPPGFDCMTARGEPCTIQVSLVADDHSYLLTVGDNGVGLPPGFDPASAKSLGLKLVNFLSRHQLRAEISIRQEKGTVFIFRLNKNEVS